MSDLTPARRRRIEALLRTRDDWVRIPGARSLSGAGELLHQANGSESETERQERKAMERRYRERMQGDADGHPPDCSCSRCRLTPTEVAYRAHRASGSYAELDQALAKLKTSKTYSYWMLDRIYVQGIPVAVHEYQLDAAFRALSDLLPDLLHVPVMQLDPPSTASPADREERDRRILAWAASGKSTRWIGDKVGLSHVRVSKIIIQQSQLRKAA